jgi:hypothetical protein
MNIKKLLDFTKISTKSIKNSFGTVIVKHAGYL